ncbi:translation initiation factor 2B subunit I family (IF-2BI) [Nitrosococcus oceani ATCC 19707]|uniref:Methylthioribose-1-phosphate isomerase n=2 Tax=Nitrosococcus oceani TaxID=1229 RepID=MTNA_NITOC|nr:S-methyl-5-thioribose-1-phosphate isomerase [Nitrosococcus oceani]Q3J8U5.1 RecName: Full=Methylthioribose-1-phosphate isomerase; Short=M1Pi; Short=MTR-1-P isomerase; AltName: Full=S-methyl-5-thioribose-1-phosphate isomerase [Nitrosococcus oceani ATCC 19707]KFI18831.1 methylthioribose-1-phosphate isomerase [Nitrosococcus oceani C-27]ABA58751.1 translation initiation factor 2B subunit I family (IF-2BI) [Nitrosococcus oceani ATCC 19707]EDZ66973.1 methylthioribose-1-phosphate isomerase [Nitrosoc
MSAEHDQIRAVAWTGAGVRLLDQRRLPQEEIYWTIACVSDVAQAITKMVVRGAPAIGIAAAYGVVLAARARFSEAGSGWKQLLEADLCDLEAARPTAINLAWALARMQAIIQGLPDHRDPESALLVEARCIHEEDIAANRRMGELGTTLIEGSVGVLTHCNTGSLATGGFGTALGVIRHAYGKGRIEKVFADETRPWLQGARLTTWELLRDGIPVVLIADSVAPYLLGQGEVQWVIVGADRIAANGDTANKIGSYGLAVAARYHNVRFMVVAPTSTIDWNLSDGTRIPIEQRPPEEVLTLGGKAIATVGAEAYNPAFDVIPAHLIDAIVTERGVVRQPTHERMKALFG